MSFKFVATAAMSSMSAAAAKATSQTSAAALVFLHGLGDTPAGWSSLQYTLPQIIPRLGQLEYVFPPAPTIPISINGGMRMPGWFDLFDWPVAVGVTDDTVGQLRAVEQIEQVLNDLVQTKGIPRHRIVVGGFSQGGAIAMLSAYHYDSKNATPRPPVAACVSLSGWLTLTNDFSSSSSSSSSSSAKTLPHAATPLFWAHGQYDDKVLFAQQAHGVKLLQKAGVTNIETHQYPMGHESCGEEIQALAQFLDKILFHEEEEEEQQQQPAKSNKEL